MFPSPSALSRRVDRVSISPHPISPALIVAERVNFEPVIDAPHGKTRAEVRTMYIWLDELKPGLIE